MVKWTVIICQVTFSELTLMTFNHNAEEDGGAGAGLTVRSWYGVSRFRS